VPLDRPIGVCIAEVSQADSENKARIAGLQEFSPASAFRAYVNSLRPLRLASSRH